MNNKFAERLAPITLLVAVIILWEIICRVFEVSEFIFPSPSQILQANHQIF